MTLLVTNMELLERFGDAGLVFVVMAIVIYFLYKEFKRERSAKEEAQRKLVEHIEKRQERNIESNVKFSAALENLAEKFVDLKNYLTNGKK